MQGLKLAARGSLKIQDAKIAKKSPSGRHRTTLSGYVFATKARIDNQKKNLLKPNSITLAGSNQLRTISEAASVMEFGFKAAISPPHVITIW